MVDSLYSLKFFIQKQNTDWHRPNPAVTHGPPVGLWALCRQLLTRGQYPSHIPLLYSSCILLVIPLDRHRPNAAATHGPPVGLRALCRQLLTRGRGQQRVDRDA